MPSGLEGCKKSMRWLDEMSGDAGKIWLTYFSFPASMNHKIAHIVVADKPMSMGSC